MAILTTTEEYYQISLILIFAAFAIPIARKVSVAEIPILIVLGIVFGPILGFVNTNFAVNLMNNFLGHGFGLLALMFILYYESHNINFRVLRRHFWRIISLDTVGIVITAILAGALFSFITGAPFLIGFLFGAIVSPTDPVTLIPLFRRMRIKEDLSGTLIGESLFNDPLGIILVTIGIVLVAPNSSYVSLFDVFSAHLGLVGGLVSFFILQVSVPSAIGIAVGFTVIYLNKLLNFENFIVGLLLGIVILEFTFLEAVGFTPFTALIATGAIVGNFSDKSIFWNRESNFQQNVSFLLTTVIFLLLGSQITRSDLVNFALIGFGLSLVVIFVTRPVSVFAALAVSGRKGRGPPLNNRIRLFFSLTGPRGVVTVVLSTLPYSVGLSTGNASLEQWGPLISVAASMVVLFSIVLQTIYLPILSNRLFGSGEENNNAEQIREE